MSLHKVYWQNKLELHNICKVPLGNQLTLSGYSRAGYRTSFKLEELKLYFDAGLSTFDDVYTVLISHGHMDHCFSIGSFVRNSNIAPLIVAPTRQISQIKDIVAAQYAADCQCTMGVAHGMLKDRADFKGMKYNDMFVPQLKGKTRYNVICYKMDHRIDTLGYGLQQIKRKLNPIIDNLALPQSKLVKLIKLLKSNGDHSLTIKQYISCGVLNPSSELLSLTSKNLRVEVAQHQIAYLTDTTAKIFSNPELLKYPIIITECTFWDEADYNEAAPRGHTHIRDLAPIILNSPQTVFILIHMSLRYKDEHIVSFVKQQFTTKAPENLWIWLDKGPINIFSQEVSKQ